MAEIMIVLGVVGILTAIILPSAIHLIPDENVLKFKKANTTFHKVINELVNSDKFYTPGDLSRKPDGTIIRGGFQLAGDPSLLGSSDDVKYLCQTMAEILSAKTVNCSTAKTGENGSPTFAQIPSHAKANSWDFTLAEAKDEFDAKCNSTAAAVGEEIVTPDGVVYYQANPAATFGVAWPDGTLFTVYRDGNGFWHTYKMMCIDVDGIGKGEPPFGYGLRADGRIISGARASEWTKRSAQSTD